MPTPKAAAKAPNKLHPLEELWWNTVFGSLFMFTLSMLVMTYLPWFHPSISTAYVVTVIVGSIGLLWTMRPNGPIRRMCTSAMTPGWLTRRVIPLCLLSIATYLGCLSGWWLYKSFGEAATLYANTRLYENAVPVIKSTQYADGGRLVFATGSTYDRAQAVGFYDDDDQIYCVAPVTSGSGEKLTRAEFWAVGTNCCKEQFECGRHDGGDKVPQTGAIVVMDERGLFPGAAVRGKFNEARRKAEATFGMQPNEEATYVRWVPTEFARGYDRELQCVLCRCIMAAMLFYVFVMHRLVLYVCWKVIGPGHPFSAYEHEEEAYFKSATSADYHKEMEASMRREETSGHGEHATGAHAAMHPGMPVMFPGSGVVPPHGPGMPVMMVPGSGVMPQPGRGMPVPMVPGSGTLPPRGPGMPMNMVPAPGVLPPGMMRPGMAGPGMVPPGMMAPNMMRTGWPGMPLQPMRRPPPPQMDAGYSFTRLMIASLVSTFVIFVITAIFVFPYRAVAFGSFGGMGLEGFTMDTGPLSWLFSWTHWFCYLCPFYHFNLMAGNV
eukprot:TRINITY_DN14271_c0_g1_i1.p1 TRINITY_DN14271_c0_g1~~TRINITY_DN14271_c0_g1_i1.p1  ORF type:complete len:596 (-),score=57.33 TRINITY_DN14271_c0_g1_i1:160-1806(-)